VSLLDGKVAIVTGGARGIGRAIAEVYAEKGATVVLADLDLAEAQATAKTVPRATALACDIRDEEQVAGLVADALGRHGRLDVFVANAGVAFIEPILSTTLEQWRGLTSVNLDGTFLCTKHAAPAMIAAGGGSIINISSITAFRGTPLAACYAATKAALISFTKSAAVELRDAGVRVNVICPGFMQTDLFRQAQELGAGTGIDIEAELARAQGGLGDPRHIAQMAAFLGSDRSSFCTGGTFVVDNGMAPTIRWTQPPPAA
jgi:NAD(P)-dependent dehydrogenase (short-subunit alcohol dehydrogenase family)